MRKRTIASAALALLLTAGCAHQGPLKGKGPTPESIKATAIVELRNHEVTERGRAVFTATNPDSFTMEIKGPLGITAARVRGDRNGLTISLHGKDESFSTKDLPLPIDLHVDELVALLLGSTKTPQHPGTSAKTRTQPSGRTITVSQDDHVLYEVILRDYRKVDGYVLPFYMAVKGLRYQLVIKITRLIVNPKFKKTGSK